MVRDLEIIVKLSSTDGDDYLAHARSWHAMATDIVVDPDMPTFEAFVFVGDPGRLVLTVDPATRALLDSGAIQE